MKQLALRQDFPYFSCSSCAYLDSAATSLKPESFLEATHSFYAHENAPVHRGMYKLSEDVTDAYEGVRKKVADWLFVKPTEIVFTPGFTYAANMIAHAWGAHSIAACDEIVISSVEHHSSLFPWRELAYRLGATLKFIDADAKTFLLDPHYKFSKRTKLLVITAESNVLGPVWQSIDDLKKIIDAAHAVGALVFVDGAQYSPFNRVNLHELGVDFYAFSAHKMLGPTGLGILYINEKVMRKMSPHHVGGGMILDAAIDNPSWADGPQFFEAGTPPAAQVVGFGAVLDYYAKNFDAELWRQHFSDLMNYTIDELKKFENLVICGNEELLRERGHLVSFYVNGIHSHDVATLLAAEHVAVRAGYHCAQLLHEKLGLKPTLRISFHVYSDRSDVDMFIAGLRKSIDFVAQIGERGA